MFFSHLFIFLIPLIVVITELFLQNKLLLVYSSGEYRCVVLTASTEFGGLLNNKVKRRLKAIASNEPIYS